MAINLNYETNKKFHFHLRHYSIHKTVKNKSKKENHSNKKGWSSNINDNWDQNWSPSIKLRYFMKIIKNICIVSCTLLLILLGCNDYSGKKDELWRINDEFNEAISRKDWAKVFEYFQKSREAGIFISEERKESFIAQNNRASAGGTIKVETINSNKQSGVTQNLITVHSNIAPFIASEDISYNFWIYKNNDWYIEDWDIRLNEIKEEFSDSIYNSILERINK